MTVGNVQTVDFLLTTDYPNNTSGAITEALLRDGFESAFSFSALTNAATNPLVPDITYRGRLILMNFSVANTFNVPTNASVAYPIGARMYVLQYGTGQTTVGAVTPGTTNVRNASSNTTRAQYSLVGLIKINTDEWLLFGDVT